MKRFKATTFAREKLEEQSLNGEQKFYRNIGKFSNLTFYQNYFAVLVRQYYFGP
jgi:hypothetical protein